MESVRNSAMVLFQLTSIGSDGFHRNQRRGRVSMDIYRFLLIPWKLYEPAQGYGFSWFHWGPMDSMESARTSLRSSLKTSLRTSLKASLRTSLRTSLKTSRKTSLRTSLRTSLKTSLGTSLKTYQRASLRTSLGTSLRGGACMKGASGVRQCVLCWRGLGRAHGNAGGFASARLAQSAERKALNLVVVGSSPTVGVFLFACQA